MEYTDIHYEYTCIYHIHIILDTLHYIPKHSTIRFIIEEMELQIVDT